MENLLVRLSRRIGFATRLSELPIHGEAWKSRFDPA
jgi:hypothetical protein